MYYLEFKPYSVRGRNECQLGVTLNITDVQFRYRLLTHWEQEEIYIHIWERRFLSFFPYKVLTVRIGPRHYKSHQSIPLELNKEIIISFTGIKMRKKFINASIKSFLQLEKELISKE